MSDETDLNIYNLGRDDWNDMNTVNEIGLQARRYLYRTHEISFPYCLPGGGEIAVVDLESDKVSIPAQNSNYNSLDGPRGER